MPSFAIEAQGETNPLNAQTIINTLTSASGANGAQSVSVATQQLANWERTSGYFVVLQDVYITSSLPPEIRFQAIIQLKNGVDRYWRKTAANAINKVDKQQIRSRAMPTGVKELIPALSFQNALMIAKIVRQDYPADWPDAVSSLVDHIRQAVKQTQNQDLDVSIANTLVITLQVVKELASGRLLRTRKNLQQIAPELLACLFALYTSHIDQWTKGSSEGDLTFHLLRNSHAALKSLRRLLIAGFEHPHHAESVRNIWSVLVLHHGEFWNAFLDTSYSVEIRELLFKHVFQFSKLFLDMARTHPASFALLGSMEVLSRFWTIVSTIDPTAPSALASAKDLYKVYRNGDVQEDDDSPKDKLSLKGLLLFRACVKMVFNPVQTFKLQTPQDKEDRQAAVGEVRKSVFTDDFVLRLMEVLVTQYFVLRPADLRDWEQEPDEWEKREEEIADSWEYSLRSCSEKLFLDILINYKELLVPRLLQVFWQYANVANTDVLVKESLYASIGVAAPVIEDVLDFNTFLRTVLVPEVQTLRSNYHILRRRVAILLGQWVPIKPTDIDRVAVYQIFDRLLRQDDLNDQVVRVTAGRQLRLVLEPFEFDWQVFEPYATSILQNLMAIIKQTELSETKLALLETVRVAVGKLEDHIEPYGNDIMSMLPALWQESGEEHLMKQAILTLITAIISSLKSKSLAYHAAVLPLIYDAVQPGSETLVYLLEEALDLWAAILQQTPSENVPDDVLKMASSLLPLFDLGSEALRQTLDLLESYAILSPTTITLPDMLNPLLHSLTTLLPALNTSRARDAALAPHVIERLIEALSVSQAFPSEAAQQQEIKTLITSMAETPYLTTLLSLLKQAYTYHQDPHPVHNPPDLIGPGETSLFQILARLILANPSFTLETFTSWQQSLHPTLSPSWLITEWLTSIDTIGDVIRKKLQVLALTSLLPVAPQMMLEHLQSLLAIWTDICTELGEGAAEQAQGDYLWLSTESSSGLAESAGVGESEQFGMDESPEETRKRAIEKVDPACAVNIRHFTARSLRSVVDMVGGPERFEQEWLSKIDGEVVKGFVGLGIL